MISLIAKEYGYKGKEIAEYIRKYPAIVTRDIKGKVNLEVEIEKLISILNDERTNVNSQDPTDLLWSARRDNARRQQMSIRMYIVLLV